MSSDQSSGNVWAVFHRASRRFSDVAVASSRADDPDEWQRAHYEALRNLRDYQREAERWAQIADDLGHARGVASHEQAVKSIPPELRP